MKSNGALRLARILLVAGLALFAACSSAPKASGAIYEKRDAAGELSKKGDASFNQGKYAEALGYYKQALEKDISVDYEVGIIATRGAIGKTYAASGMYAEAAEQYGQASDLARRINRPDLAAGIESYQAESMIKQGDVDGAESVLAAARAKVGKNRAALALILHNLGLCARARENYREAADCFAQAAAINLDLKKRIEYASNCYMLASAWLKLDKADVAREWALKALRADKDSEHSQGIALDYYALGKIELHDKKSEEAWFDFKTALNVCLVANDAELSRRVLDELVSLATERGDAESLKRYTDMREQIKSLLSKPAGPASE
jgi:tetratricopeptide (TPR) repeat protein